MKRKYIPLFIIPLLLFYNCNTDNDQGIIEPPVLTENIEVYNPYLIEDSYVFAIENGGTKSYLLNKSGSKIKEWTFDTNLGNDLELMPDGKLLGMFTAENPSIYFGGVGGIVKLLNIDGTPLWEYEYASVNYISHHDVEMLSNGNVLFLVWEKVTAAEAQSFGVNTTVDIYPEALIEVNPNNNQIVWEWHSWNHIIQNIDSSVSNFGIVSNNPQLIDINYNLNSTTNGDIMHANGIDVDEVRNVIFMSINKYSEVWVIDHSTTTAEASTHIGGTYNKGGDLLYRFGNPEAYNNSFGQRLFYNNHFPNFIENNMPGAGNLLIYENGTNINQSTVYELAIPETFNLQANTNNEPNIVWSFTNEDLFFGRLSGAVRLNNGNTLICEGDYGFWEVTPNDEIVWKYKNLEPGVVYWRAYNYLKNSSEISSLGL